MTFSIKSMASLLTGLVVRFMSSQATRVSGPSSRFLTQTEVPDDSPGLLESHGCLNFCQPPSEEQSRFPSLLFFLRANEARYTGSIYLVGPHHSSVFVRCITLILCTTLWWERILWPSLAPTTIGVRECLGGWPSARWVSSPWMTMKPWSSFPSWMWPPIVYRLLEPSKRLWISLAGGVFRDLHVIRVSMNCTIWPWWMKPPKFPSLT